MNYIMYTDGGSRGNPGPAAIGVYITSEDNKPVAEISRYIGHGTNNEAEYTALIEGLKKIVEFSPKSIKCYLDSELVVRQLTGVYKVKNERISELFKQVKRLELSCGKITYAHIPREKNAIADKLVNEALDKNA